MSKIFISYRRQDSKPIVTLVYAPLAKHFEAKYGLGAVFMDVHGIPKGFDFHDYLNEQVGKAEVLLALIADRWLTASEEQGRRRLDNPDDFVRIEIEAALSRKIPIIPIYVDGVRPLRSDDLPDTLKPLARRNGAFLDTGVDFPVHIERLIHDIEPHLDGRYRPAPSIAQIIARHEPSRANPSPQPAISIERFGSKPVLPPFQYEDVPQRLVRTFIGHTSSVQSVAFSPDGGTILSGDGADNLKLWTVSTGKVLSTNNLNSGFAGGVETAIFSPQGNQLLSGGPYKLLSLWDLSWKKIRSLSGHSTRVTSAAFSGDGTLALTGSHDNTIKLWQIPTGSAVRTFNGHQGWVWSVAISLDGRFGLSGSVDETLRLWDLATGREVRSFKGHAGSVHSVAITPDGRCALSGGNDETLKLWDLATGREVRSFKGHAGSVRSVAITPDGRCALSGSTDKTLKLWDLATGRELRTLKGHASDVQSVAFTAHGDYGLSGSADKTIKLWDVSEWTQAR
ncbi:MAG: toll/interleukin-1 receptor domain-containing protein [Rhodomicrobium sp.]